MAPDAGETAAPTLEKNRGLARRRPVEDRLRIAGIVAAGDVMLDLRTRVVALQVCHLFVDDDLVLPTDLLDLEDDNDLRVARDLAQGLQDAQIAARRRWRQPHDKRHP